MGDVTTLTPKQVPTYYITGECKCTNCQHQWMAEKEVDPASDDAMLMECPECHLNRGIMMNNTVPKSGQTCWHCKCGSTYFFILYGEVTKTPEIACVGCGKSQRF